MFRRMRHLDGDATTCFRRSSNDRGRLFRRIMVDLATALRLRLSPLFGEGYTGGLDW